MDNLGIYEFDPQSKNVVATHTLAEGIGGDPYPSLDGSKYKFSIQRNFRNAISNIEMLLLVILPRIHCVTW